MSTGTPQQAQFTESPSAYTTSFQLSPNTYFSEPEECKPKDLSFPFRYRSGPSRSSTISQNTAVDSVSPVDDGPDSFWGEEKHVWISASSSQNNTTRRRRTLVLCFDGTGDQFDGDVRDFTCLDTLQYPNFLLTQNSNVVQFLAMLKKDNNNEQLVYYQVLLS